MMQVKTGGVLLLLLAGRIQPAALTMQHFRPAIVGCIVSMDTRERASAMQRLVQRSHQECRWLEPVFVPPYEPMATRAAIEQLVTLAPGQPVAISLTGGTVPMAVAGYEMARLHDWPAYYHDTGSGQVLDLAALQGVTRVNLRPSLIDYLTIYDAQLNPTRLHPVGLALTGKWVIALQSMASRPSVTAELLSWLFAGKKSSTIGLRSLLWRLDDTHRAMLHELEELEIIVNVTWRSSGINARVQLQIADSEALAFLNGRWLEQYVFQEAQTVKLEAEPLFDDCAHSVHFVIGGALRELDFMAVRRGRLMVGSCKTAKNPWDKQALDELVAATKNLGDNYVIKLYITNQIRPTSGHRLERSFGEFAEQAQKARVVVITGDELLTLRDMLCKEAVTPSYASN